MSSRDPRDLDRLRLELSGALLDLPWAFKGYVASTAGECVGETTDLVMDVVCDWLKECAHERDGLFVQALVANLKIDDVNRVVGTFNGLRAGPNIPEGPERLEDQR